LLKKSKFCFSIESRSGRTKCGKLQLAALCANFAFEFKNELLKKIEIKNPFQLK
jgi:hypothetical protein